MQTLSQPRTRKLTIIAQDPSVRVRGRILRAAVEVPAEEIAPGPWGYRVHTIDYDASTDTLYRPIKYRATSNGELADPFAEASDAELLNDPAFHAQNVYAIVMRTLARFEFALGRRVSWGFYGHQIKVAPHAFADANAFYSEREQALMFGYFPAGRKMVFSCLSHDIVAHETTHALLDGLRQRYTDPSSPDQAAFHEGFADIVALLSVFALPEVVSAVLDLQSAERTDRIARSKLSQEALRRSLLFGLAKEMGQELSGVRGNVLRRSVELKPSPTYLTEAEFQQPHRRGEVLVAAVLNAFIAVWTQRLQHLGQISTGQLSRERVVEEGANIADYLLTMMIRAIDYTPPVDLRFADFLSAVLTSDREVNLNDGRYRFRETLRDSFRDYGVAPAAEGTAADPGIWELPDGRLSYGRTHFESMQRDPDEVFRFVWENRKALGLYEDAYSRVLSVRPCLRVGPDGFLLRETVAEYIQMVDLTAAALRRLKIEKPQGMPDDQEVRLFGGGALIFDEYGRLKYHVHNSLRNSGRQQERLRHLWDFGYFRRSPESFRNFAAVHRRRAVSRPLSAAEEW